MKLLILVAASLPIAMTGLCSTIADAAPSAFGSETTLVGQGVVGAILAWFMLRNEKHRDAQSKEFIALGGSITNITGVLGERIAKNGEKIDRLSKVILIQTMTHPDFPAAAKEQANAILKDIERGDGL